MLEHASFSDMSDAQLEHACFSNMSDAQLIGTCQFFKHVGCTVGTCQFLKHVGCIVLMKHVACQSNFYAASSGSEAVRIFVPALLSLFFVGG